MTTVLRFENADGEGPYRVGGATRYDEMQQHRTWHSCQGIARLSDQEERETPAGRYVRRNGITGYRYGFISKNQLLASFPSPEGRAAMADVGIRLTVWDVKPDDVLEGATQCIFKRDQARMIQTIDLTTLKPEVEVRLQGADQMRPTKSENTTLQRIREKLSETISRARHAGPTGGGHVVAKMETVQFLNVNTGTFDRDFDNARQVSPEFNPEWVGGDTVITVDAAHELLMGALQREFDAIGQVCLRAASAAE